MTEMYLSDADMFSSVKKYSAGFNEIFAEI